MLLDVGTFRTWVEADLSLLIETIQDVIGP